MDKNYFTPKKAKIEPTLANVRIFIDSLDIKLVIHNDDSHYRLNGKLYCVEYSLSHFFLQELYDCAVMEGFKKSGLRKNINLLASSFYNEHKWRNFILLKSKARELQQ